MSYYELLGTSTDADFKELKKAYFRRAKEIHPDRHGGSRIKEEQFKELVAAFDVLSDPTRRAAYDCSLGCSDDVFSYTKPQPIMDSESDDTLEEIIVGNSLPSDTSIGTLFRDLEQTEVFMIFREAKTLYHQKKFKAALPVLRRAIAKSPGNIVYRCYLARTLAILQNFKEAKVHYRAAIAMGSLRKPPQRMIRIKKEYEAVAKMHRPWLNRIFRFFIDGVRDPFIPCSSDSMVDDMNRVMNQMLADEQKKKNTPKELDK